MLRKVTSLTLLFSSIIVGISSVVLYVGPPSHIAFFSDWRFWGLEKYQWNSLHLMGGILFIIGVVLHSYYNWKAILRYMKTKDNKLIIATMPGIISLFITALVCVNAILFLPPTSLIAHLGHEINQEHLHTYDVFPFGQPDKYSLKKAAIYMGKTPQKCLASLRECGFEVESAEQSIGRIAENNDISTSVVLETIRKDVIIDAAR